MICLGRLSFFFLGSAIWLSWKRPGDKFRVFLPDLGRIAPLVPRFVAKLPHFGRSLSSFHHIVSKLGERIVWT